MRAGSISSRAMLGTSPGPRTARTASRARNDRCAPGSSVRAAVARRCDEYARHPPSTSGQGADAPASPPPFCRTSIPFARGVLRRRRCARPPGSLHAMNERPLSGRDAMQLNVRNWVSADAKLVVALDQLTPSGCCRGKVSLYGTDHSQIWKLLCRPFTAGAKRCCRINRLRATRVL